MCEECFKSPCHPRCPNAPDPPVCFICSGCGENIVLGQDYWEIMGEQFCENCIDDSRKVAEYEPY